MTDQSKNRINKFIKIPVTDKMLSDCQYTEIVHFCKNKRDNLESAKHDYDFGWCIAGGAARSLLLNSNPTNDVDLYNPMLDIEESFIDNDKGNIRIPWIKGCGIQCGRSLDERKRMSICNFWINSLLTNPANINYQIILYKSYQINNMMELMDTFDYTCSLFFTDGFNVYTTEQAIEDVNNKALRWNPDTTIFDSEVNVFAKLKRAYKYLSQKGYTWASEEEAGKFFKYKARLLASGQLYGGSSVTDEY